MDYERLKKKFETMKGLTIEEKAKIYGEALERAKKLQETCDSTAVVGWCEYIFPELKESEDERIRKELIEQVAYIIPNDDEVDSEGNALSTYQKRIDKYRAWLEKQGEQNVEDFSQTCKMMTIDEAIEHCKEKSCDDTICGKNHKQLAEWLAELKGYRTSVTQETQKTSDKDEKIRKELMDFIYVTCFPVKDLKKKERFLDWLEKQGKQEPYGKRKECEDCQFNYAGECKGYCQMKRDEQKPVDNVKPKFNEGDWICNDMCIVRIESINNGMYYFYEGDGLSIAFVDKHYHLWTIRDAKDGDVLISSNKQPFVYNGNYATDCLGSDNLNGNYTSVRLGAYFGLTITGELLICDSYGNNWTDLTGVQPATEEERNALFKKLHDSDYEWDGKKKELWHKYL